jgi:hypothetical protein
MLYKKILLMIIAVIAIAGCNEKDAELSGVPELPDRYGISKYPRAERIILGKYNIEVMDNFDNKMFTGKLDLNDMKYTRDSLAGERKVNGKYIIENVFGDFKLFVSKASDFEAKIDSAQTRAEIMKSNFNMIIYIEERGDTMSGTWDAASDNNTFNGKFKAILDERNEF